MYFKIKTALLMIFENGRFEFIAIYMICSFQNNRVSMIELSGDTFFINSFVCTNMTSHLNIYISVK